MITTSKELIGALEAKFQTKVSCICCLEKSCIKSPRCTAYHTIELLDFDKIKDTICHNKRIESVASVDGILERNDTLCFVELKSWENYLKYQKPKAETDIQAQLDTYDLNSKLIESMNILFYICIHLFCFFHLYFSLTHQALSHYVHHLLLL